MTDNTIGNLSRQIESRIDELFERRGSLRRFVAHETMFDGSIRVHEVVCKLVSVPVVNMDTFEQSLNLSLWISLNNKTRSVYQTAGLFTLESIRDAICYLFFDGKFQRPYDHPLNDATFRGLLNSLAAMGNDELVPSGIYADRLEELGHPKWAKAVFELVTPPPKDFGRRLVSQCLAYEVLGDALWRGCARNDNVLWRNSLLIQLQILLQDYCIREYGGISDVSSLVRFRFQELSESYAEFFKKFPND